MLNRKTEKAVWPVSIKILSWSVLLMLPMETVYMSRIESIDRFFFVGRLVFDVIVLFILLVNAKIRIGYPVIIFICFYATILISTIYNGGKVLGQGENSLTNSCLILFINYIMQKNPQKAICSFLLMFEILVYINFALLLIFPEGVYIQGGRGVWLFGQANESTLYLTCAVMIAFIYSYYVKKKDRCLGLRSLILIAVCVLSTLMTGSATSIVGFVLMMTVILAYSVFRIKISPIWGVIVSGLIFIFLVVFRYQEYFRDFIVRILHRNMTFSNRLRLWDSAFYFIVQKPFWGYGMETRLASGERFFGYATPHNKILYLMYLGGGILITIFTLIILFSLKKIKDSNAEMAKAFISGPVIALLVQMQFESYTLFPFWIPFLFGMYIENISSLRTQNEEWTKLFFYK